MKVNKLEVSNQIFPLHAYYAQPEGPLGCLEVTVHQGGRIEVELMGRESLTAPEGHKQLRAALVAEGYEFNTNHCSFSDAQKPDVIRFLKENGVIDPDPKVTTSPIIAQTGLTLGQLTRSRLLNVKVASEIASDVSKALGRRMRPEDIYTMPIPAKAARLAAERQAPAMTR